ncbi:MAG TPA: N-6 DNA methylase [Ureibacillus sp.]|nr:N-6 DNA methylase [Ureibacillus sp.]
MKNSTTTLWKSSELLRGGTPLSKQRKIMSSIFTLKSVENNEHLIIPETAKWKNIIFQGQNLKNNIISAFEQIEEQNIELKGVFAIKEIEELDDDILERLISLFNQTQSTPELFEELLFLFASGEGKSGGEFITPHSIAELLPALLDIKGGSVYDGTAGAAHLLIEAAKYAQKYEQGVHLYGQELNQSVWALGKMNLLMHEYKHDYALGNTLSDPAFANGQLMKFDYVLMNFPFSLKEWGREKAEYDLYNRYIYGLPSKSNADLAFVQHALSSLKEDGKAAVIVTHGTLFRGGADKKIREAMIEDDVIEAVIGLPSNLFFTTGIPTVILILNKNKSPERKRKIQFINAQDTVDKVRGQNILRKEDQEKIINAYHKGEEIKQYSTFVSVEEIEDANLNIANYFSLDDVESVFGDVLVNKDAYENSPIPKIELKELVTMTRGMNTPPKKELDQTDGQYYLLQLADIQDGNIQFDQLTSIDIDERRASMYEVEEGDILLSSRGSSIKIAIVPAINKRLIISHNFISIRPNNGVNPYFLKAFLESPIGTYYISSKQKGTAVTILSVKDIESIPVPNLDSSIQSELGNAFVKADSELAKVIKQAQEKHSSDYYELYEKMGLTSSFKSLED